ncbi:hypothetical protein LTR66_004344 [Elasticomyces elasticus]|nr:hypothetical protein LTR66_004344 [Elasticomyces elasticus]
MAPASKKSSAKSASTATSSNSHPYLEPRRASDIKSWSSSITGPASSRHPAAAAAAVAHGDPAVQAYINAKLALFQSAPRGVSLTSGSRPGQQ